MKNTPLRTYYFSDTYGGQDEWNPLRQMDADVLISTDFGSRPTEKTHREFDIFGQEEVVAHLLRLIVAKHDELTTRLDLTDEQKNTATTGGTGVFINSAPRIGRTNAEPFYLATARDGAIRIVTTPLSALSGIRKDIQTLTSLPNPKPDETNGLYNGREQFRSQYTPRLLDPNHQLNLQEENIDHIPEPRSDWHIAYVDRFGNVITRVGEVERQWNEVLRIASQMTTANKSVRLLLGDNGEAQPTPPLELARSLGEATPGIASMYRNSGGIDVVVKWMMNQSAGARLASSAWQELGKPTIGTSIKISEQEL